MSLGFTCFRCKRMSVAKSCLMFLWLSTEGLIVIVFVSVYYSEFSVDTQHLPEAPTFLYPQQF